MTQKNLICSKFSLILMRNREICPQSAQKDQNCRKSCQLPILLRGEVKKDKLKIKTAKEKP